MTRPANPMLDELLWIRVLLRPHVAEVVRATVLLG